MLSAETAAGRYPVEAVRVMDRIVRAAEEGAAPGVVRATESAPSVQDSFPEAMCEAACSAITATRVDAVVAFSESGATARLMSKQRPAAPIVAVTPSETVRRRMALYWGVVPLTMPRIEQTDARVHEIERRLKEEGLAKSGQKLVILSGTIIGQRGGTNVMKLHEVA